MRIVPVVMLALAVAGCGSGSHVSPATAQSYLQRLRAEQIKLAAAEGGIPRRASSPAALGRAIALLGAAVRRLERDLAAINPPGPVKTLHARLVAIAHTYALQLGRTARTARRPGGEPAAAQALTTSTDTTSRAFSRTAASITSKLRHSA